MLQLHLQNDSNPTHREAMARRTMYGTGGGVPAKKKIGGQHPPLFALPCQRSLHKEVGLLATFGVHLSGGVRALLCLCLISNLPRRRWIKTRGRC